MLNLTEYRTRPTQLADYLPWAGLIAPGVVLNKDGAFQRTARFRGPDLDSVTDTELLLTASRINNALKRLGSGWAVFVEARRESAGTYPGAQFADPLAWLVDEERRASFETAGAHFESQYHLTLLFLPPSENQVRAGRWLLDRPNEPQTTDWRGWLASFMAETDRILSLLEGVMPEIAWLDDAQTLSFLHSTVATQPHALRVPEVPFFLDSLLASAPLTGGLAPMLGDEHLRMVSVRGFPTSSWPGVLDELNRLGFAYRWVTRFICFDKPHAERELTRLRRQWFAKRKSIMTLLRETIFQQESPLVDTDADNKAADADAALQELGADHVSYGCVTAVIVLSDRDAARVDDMSQAVQRVIQNRGFVTINESFNAVEAWLSSLPGHAYANVRQPLISTLNLAHLMPLSAVWAGPARNAHLNGAPLLMTRTAGATPFRFVTHVGDVGHMLVVGPTGAGKSVFTNTLVLQFPRYPNAQVFVFDVKRSARATVLGLGGEHFALTPDGIVAFQPLSRIDDPAERVWAADWTTALLEHEGVTVTPDLKSVVWAALGSLASAPPGERTLTGLSVLLPSNSLRQALQPYTLGGPYGRLLDADHDQLTETHLQCFEMEDLLTTRSAALPVLMYLFHRLEARFNGRPTLIVLAEAWRYLDHGYFADRLRAWFKTLRKLNVSVVLDTQALAELDQSPIAPALIESCPTRIFLPSVQALEPRLRQMYASFGLNDRQISIIGRSRPKRDYYYQSPLGQRLFELDLGPIALAFATAASPEDQRDIDAVLAAHGSAGFAREWLRLRGLPWAAQLLQDFYTHPGASR